MFKKIFTLAILFIFSSSLAFADKHSKSVKTKTTKTFTITNKLVNKAKVWIPEFKTIKAGEVVQFNLVNTLDAPHGFEIVGITKGVIVPPKKSTTISLTTPKNEVLAFKCHMHPAHIGGVIQIEQ